MATVPVSGTNVRFLAGVSFSNDYKHTRWFDSLDEQYSYFNARTIVHSIAQCNFQRVEGKTFIRTNKSIDDLRGTNYIMFQNNAYSSKWFYAFVTQLEYVNQAVTNVHFQLDVMQTWRFDYTFRPTFVVREHCKLWNEDGSPVINTVDEGLNYGSAYDNMSIENYVPYKDNFFLVVVAKKKMHGGSAETGKYSPTVNGSPQPLNYYIHPFKLNGNAPNVTMSGININLSKVDDLLINLYTQDDAVNNIVSIYVTEYLGYAPSFDEGTDTLSFDMSRFDHATIQDGDQSVNTLYLKKMTAYGQKLKGFGDKYEGYASVKESKLLMYPYTVLILDDFKGNRTEFRNEFIDSNLLNVSVRGSMGTSNKVVYSIDQYHASNIETSNDMNTLALEHSLINSSPNDVPIITDMLSAYLQGNRNSIEVQKQSIVANSVMNNVGLGISGVVSAVTRNGGGVGSAIGGIAQGTVNSVLSLEAIEAKQQDINNIPPQIQKMGTNTAFDYGNGYNGLFVIKKQIKPEYRKKLGDFFKAYGYKVNELKMPNLHTRQNWNYIQTLDANIRGNINNEDLQEIKNVFNNGITLWHNDAVGNYLLENEVI